MSEDRAQSKASSAAHRALSGRVAGRLLGIAAVLAVLVAVAVVCLPPLATWVILRRLDALGLGDSVVTVKALTPSCAVLGPVQVGGSQHGVSAEQVVISYTVEGLRQRVVDDVVINGFAATVTRQQNGQWKVAGLEAWPTASAADKQAGFRVRRVRIVGAAITVDPGVKEAVEVSFDGEAAWQADNRLTGHLAARVFGDGVLVSAALDLDAGDGSVRMESDGLTLSRWRDEWVGVLGPARVPPQVTGNAIVKGELEIRAWQAESCEVTIRGPRWGVSFRAMEPDDAGSQPSGRLASGGAEMVAPDVTIRGDRSKTDGGVSFTVTHSLQSPQTSAVAVTDKGLVRVLTGDMTWEGDWDMTTLGLGHGPTDSKLTLNEVTAEMDELSWTADSLAATLTGGNRQRDWRVEASSRVSRAAIRDWTVGAGTVNLTVQPSCIEVTSSGLPVAREHDVSATIAVKGTVTRDEGDLSCDMALDVQQLILAGTHTAKPFVLTAKGTPDELSLGIDTFELESLPYMTVENAQLDLTFRPSPLKGSLNARLSVDSQALSAVPGELTSETETVGIEVKGVLSPEPGGPLLDLDLTLPRQSWRYRLGEAETSGRLSLEWNLAGDLHKAKSKGSLRLSDIGVENASVKAGLTTCEIRLNQGTIRPRAILAAGSLRDALAACQGDILLTASGGKASWENAARIEDVSVRLPATWKGRGFDAGTSGVDAGKGSIRLGRAAFGPLSFEQAAVSLKLTGQSLVADGGMTSVDGSVRLTAEGQGHLTPSPASEAGFEVRIEDLAEAAWLPALMSRMGVDAVASAAGGLSLSGQVTHDPVRGLAGRLEASLSQADIVLEDPPVTVNGLAADVTLDSLFDMTSPPHQKVTFRELTIGRMPFGEGTVSLQLEGTDGLFLERADVAWCGGTLSTYALQLRPELDQVDVLLYADSISLGQLFALQHTVKGSASGTLYGKIPVTWRNGNLSYESGFLYAVPGAQGALKLENAALLTRNLPDTDPRVDQAKNALEHLQYDVLRLDVEGKGELTRLTIRVEGRSATDDSLPPVKLNTTIEANINELIDVGRQLNRLQIKTQ